MLNLGTLIEEVGKNSELKAILGDRIFLELPKKEQKGISVLFSLVSETIDTILTKRSLVDVRVMAHNQDVSLSELYSVVDLLSQSLVYDYEYKKFGCIKIIEESISPPLVDEKGRFDIVKSYLFYHKI